MENTEYTSIYQIPPVKCAPVDPRVSQETKVPRANQVNLENVAILVNQGRKEIREHLAMQLGHMDPQVHREKTVCIAISSRTHLVVVGLINGSALYVIHVHSLQIPIGEKGDKGNKGDQGYPGVKGDKGENGNEGERGDKGEPGVKGPLGESGEDGKNGTKGDKGCRGDAGIPGRLGKKMICMDYTGIVQLLLPLIYHLYFFIEHFFNRTQWQRW